MSATAPMEKMLRLPGGARVRDWLLTAGIVARDRPRAYWFTAVDNFGDALAPDVLGWAVGRPPVWVTRFYRGKVLGVGSILGRALAEGDIVWGSGLIRDADLRPPSQVTFLAVRGPLTRSRLLTNEVPEIYGDPALLLPAFHDEPVEKRYFIGLVPHHRDRALIETDDPSVLVIDVRRPWRLVVDQIRSCEVVVSSSLHGLIVAESYGIPASWIRITDDVVGGDFKFNDYYLSTGRDARSPAAWRRGLEHAVNCVAPPLRYDPEPLLAAARRIAEPAER